MTTQTPEQFAESLRSAGQTTFAQSLARRAVGLALFAESEAKQNAGRRLRVRSGNLRRSIAGTVQNQLRSPQVVLSAGGRVEGGGEVPYATTQEFGGTIRPKRVKWLAIPNEIARTPAGAARYKTARDYPRPLAFVHLGGPRAMLWDAQEEVAAYALLKKVEIKPKWYARDAMRATERRAGPDLAGTLADALGAE